ncbi:MAG: hypothetical protein HYZ53_00975 [Planctomycetes bacterium]|nr:hypothetical protein [Planctomycetota bacterium]
MNLKKAMVGVLALVPALLVALVEGTRLRDQANFVRRAEESATAGAHSTPRVGPEKPLVAAPAAAVASRGRASAATEQAGPGVGVGEAVDFGAQATPSPAAVPTAPGADALVRPKLPRLASGGTEPLDSDILPDSPAPAPAGSALLEVSPAPIRALPPPPVAAARQRASAPSDPTGSTGVATGIAAARPRTHLVLGVYVSPSTGFARAIVDGETRQPGQEVEPGWKIEEIRVDGIRIANSSDPTRYQDLCVGGASEAR